MKDIPTDRLMTPDELRDWYATNGFTQEELEMFRTELPKLAARKLAKELTQGSRVRTKWLSVYLTFKEIREVTNQPGLSRHRLRWALCETKDALTAPGWEIGNFEHGGCFRLTCDFAKAPHLRLVK